MFNHSLRRYRPWLYAAALYNLLWGTATLVFPEAYFRLVGLKPPSYIVLWQLAGMFVLVYAPAYFWAAQHPEKHAHLVLVGLFGKILGPAGFVWGALTGNAPAALGWITLTNDLFWWPAFFMYLHAVAPRYGGWLALLRGAVDSPQ